jgi:hypothetical protein
VAARRLLIVMVILLITSTVAASLAPRPAEREETTRETTSPRTSPVPTGGQLVQATLDADAKARRPERIEVPLGDQLALKVRSRRTVQVQIRGLGLLEDVQPLSPARFDILASRPGSFEVRVIDPDRPLAVIEVRRDGGPEG